MKRAGPLVVCCFLGAAFPGLWGCRSGMDESSAAMDSTERVGAAGPNRYVTPANQVLTPAGIQIELPGLRPQTLALSPDGRILVTSGKTAEIVVLDPADGRILQRVGLPFETDIDAAPDPVSGNILAPDKEGQDRKSVV